MKNIIYILGITAMILSCGDDFLRTEPVTENVDANFYKTPEDIYSAIIGCYSANMVNDGRENILLISEVASDNCFGGSGYTDDNKAQALDEFVTNGHDNLYPTTWKKYYTGIFRCNMLLSKLDGVDWGDDASLQARYDGEAHFLRAYYYFDLVRIFGNIPLVIDPEPANNPQAPADDIYSLIASDLVYAIGQMPGTKFNAIPDSELGRATKWAAQALLARVFLFYTGYYNKTELPMETGTLSAQQVVAYLEDLIVTSGHGLLPDFRNLWPYSKVAGYKYKEDNNLSYAGEGHSNPETIFSIKYTTFADWEGKDGYSNSAAQYLGWRDPNAFLPFFSGWGFATVNPKLWESWDTNDLRRSGSILSIAGEGMTEYSNRDQREETGYWQKKYQPIAILDNGTVKHEGVTLGGVQASIANEQDYVAIRYADVLLMAAELNLTSDPAKSQQYYDQIRKRAYGSNFTAKTVDRQGIMNERRFELAFEGHRYWDLLRQGLDVAKATIDEPGVSLLNGGAPVTKKITFRKETGGFFQIPKDQISLSNSVLVQNPGW